MSGERLDFAGLDLVNADGGTDELFWFETLADGFSWGSPEAVKVVVESLMRDGDDSRITRFGNRMVTFTVAARGPDLGALADAESALSIACTGRSELIYTPPDGYGPATVFDVLTATLDPVFDDLAEIRDGIKERHYALTLECEPYARSGDLVTQTLTPESSPSITVLDACTSASAWSGGGAYTATITQQTYLGESVIRATHDFDDFYIDHMTTVTWTGAAGADPYIYVDICWDGDGTPLYRSLLMAVDSTPVAPFAVDVVSHGTGIYSRYWFENDTGASSLTFTISRKWNSTSAPSDPAPLRIAQLVSSTGVGSSSIQTVETIGSVRAPGSITVTSADPMTCLFVYSDPAMLSAPYSPAIEDSWALAPDGTYVIWVKSLGSGGDVIAVTATNDAGRTSTATTRLPASPSTFRPIGEVRLGGFRDGRLGNLAFTATVNGSPSVLTMANVRLFRKHEDTAFTYLDDISAEVVELATPSVDLPRGGVWADDVACADKTLALAFPSIVPPQTALYVEGDGTDPPATSLTYYPRAHSYNAYVPET